MDYMNIKLFVITVLGVVLTGNATQCRAVNSSSAQTVLNSHQKSIISQCSYSQFE